MIAVQEWFSGRVFRFVHGRHLVYNTCWEDPRLDRVALALRPRDRLVMITSAGCNALDYVPLLRVPYYTFVGQRVSREPALNIP